jgi:hypothetical protein
MNVWDISRFIVTRDKMNFLFYVLLIISNHCELFKHFFNDTFYYLLCNVCKWTTFL